MADVVAKTWALQEQSNGRIYSGPDRNPPIPPSPSATGTEDSIIFDCGAATPGKTPVVSYRGLYGLSSGGPYDNDNPYPFTTPPLEFADFPYEHPVPIGEYDCVIVCTNLSGYETDIEDCDVLEADVDPGETPGTNDPGDPIFIDMFNYVVPVDISPAGAKEPIIEAAGWNHLKDNTNAGSQGTGARGNFSTTTTIPGYSGQMPGLSGSGRVARWAFLPVAGSNQTDAYLTKGVAGPIGAPNPAIPGDFWWQCWMYINGFGSENSHFAARNKILYPSENGTASGGGGECQWIANFRPSNQNGVTQPYEGGGANFVLHVDANLAGGDGVCISNAPEGSTRLGDNLATFPQLPNGWYLVKVHIKTDTAAGVYEKWIRPMGTQEWTKTAEWISGVTPGFTWIPHSTLRGGQNMMKWWTTFGTAAGSDTTNYQVWIYAADFCYADDEDDLPTYGEY